MTETWLLTTHRQAWPGPLGVAPDDCIEVESEVVALDDAQLAELEALIAARHAEYLQTLAEICKRHGLDCLEEWGPETAGVGWLELEPDSGQRPTLSADQALAIARDWQVKEG